MTDTINIFFAANKKFAPHLQTAIASILENAADNDNIRIFILNNDFCDNEKNEIIYLNKIKEFYVEFININNNQFASFKSPEYINSATTFYRYLIPNIKPDIDKALYLDCDIIVEKSLKELFNIDLSDNYIAGVEDPAIIVSTVKLKNRFGIKDRYVNAGVLLFNCKKMRDDNFTERCFELNKKLSSKTYFGADQDVINILTYNNKKIIDIKYNVVSYIYEKQLHTEYTDNEIENALKNPVIIHYSDYKKPWKFYGFPEKKRDYEYHKYSKMTNSYDKFFIFKASLFNNEFARKVRRIKNNLLFKIINSAFELILDICGLILSILSFPIYYFRFKRNTK